MLMTGSESPVVVVLSESMEPGFARVSNSVPFCKLLYPITVFEQLLCFLVG